MAETLRLSFECDIDAASLWDVAAERGVSDFAMSPDDIIDTIGPREDPEVEACALMLFDSIARRTDLSGAIAITPVAAVDANLPLPIHRVARSQARLAADRRWTRTNCAA